MGMFKNKGSDEISKEKMKEASIVDKIKKYYNDSYSTKNELVDTWKKNYKAYTGELFERKNCNKALGDVKINHVFATVETIKPIMLTNPPKNIVYPTSADGFEKAMMIQEALDYEWTRTHLISQMMDAITDGLVFGTMIIGLFWDGNASKGKGEITPTIISPFNFFIDPMATRIDEAQYCMYATYKPVGQLIKAYPEKAEELRKEAKTPDDNDLTFGKEINNTNNQVLFIECYFRDYTREEWVEEEEGLKYKKSKMKYPNGRRVIIAGDVLLEDGENPYQDGEFPFVAWKCYSMPGKFWGMSEVEQLIAPQKEINNLYNALMDNAKLNANPWTILDKNSGVEKGSLSNSPGLVIRKNPGSDVKRDAPPSMPAYLQQVASDLKYDLQVISGVFDATRGERPMSVTSGAGIQALQESSQGRIRLKIQGLEIMLAELGSMWLKRMQQFWTLPRQIRIMGGKVEPDTVPLIIDGKPVTFKYIDKDCIDGDFDVTIKTGSTMPVNKSARFDIIMKLAQTQAEDGLPMIDRRTIIEYADLDNADDIIKRFEQEKQLQLQQQMQQAEMEQQNAQVNMAIQQQQIEKQIKMKSDLETQSKMALQKQQADLQSEVGTIDLDNMSIEEFLAYLKTLDDAQLAELIRKQPEVYKVLKMLEALGGDIENGTTPQPSEDSKEVNEEDDKKE